MEINDQWPSPPADGIHGPFQKIHKRTGPLPGQGTCGRFLANKGVWSADLGSHQNAAGNTVFDSGHCGGSMHQNENGDGESDDTTVYQLLPSDDGDNGLSVNKVRLAMLHVSESQ